MLGGDCGKLSGPLPLHQLLIPWAKREGRDLLFYKSLATHAKLSRKNSSGKQGIFDALMSGTQVKEGAPPVVSSPRICRARS